jgi:hypothetical protein
MLNRYCAVLLILVVAVGRAQAQTAPAPPPQKSVRISGRLISRDGSPVSFNVRMAKVEADGISGATDTASAAPPEPNPLLRKTKLEN